MSNSIIEILKNGGVGVLLTDTLYGLVGPALNKKTVNRIYKIKGRNDKKPLIVLISSTEDLKIFGIIIDDKIKKQLKNFWPGPVSVILPCQIKKLEYLHRGIETLAFRLPNKRSLLEVIKKTGPLAAPSANPEGLPPAQNIKEAKLYFGDKVDFYIKGSQPKNKPSILIKIDKGRVIVLRK
ncbi:MAG: threonylcarbamoyl-AMP synthase [Candidatus Terrybacteria bacterium CG10_big_fil_rev_8_21_14_0_10_41_10]|uniref:L-threonylcarbamoyladenylate synthase n=1 Tax=Candidatus Terrybacteria bacterium CG10_big_fil_rev_8_21_14_0_10_41_10 TaxID=1975026 RepID=A0A2M8LAI0_9BACT|nr:MAG: threonylcarbamoyl-AMP synthase [Candidatus Terrybacteria bacterium CG10_big_fil_rev_8_21_14_0_10_41_10]